MMKMICDICTYNMLIFVCLSDVMMFSFLTIFLLKQMVKGLIMQWRGDSSWNVSCEGCIAGDEAAAHCLTGGNT